MIFDLYFRDYYGCNKVGSIDKTASQTVNSSAWRKTDTVWMLGLYGTAIGAGVLFCQSMQV